MTRIIGVTATRVGMTDFQIARVTSIVRAVKPTQAHHGGCDGGDRQFHNLVRSWFPFPACRIMLHPPPQEDDHYQFSWYASTPGMTVLPGEPHLKRNRIIVLNVGLLIGAPHSRAEQQRGGTWFTIREARKKSKPLVIVFPDGSYSPENIERSKYEALLSGVIS